jgi:hypothetical protein
MKRTVLGVIVALGTSAIASAQPARGQRGGPEGPPMREELMEIVQSYFVMKIQERLQLSDEQFVKVLPLVRKLQQERRDFHRRRFEAIGEMRKQLESGSATEARLRELLQEVKAIDSEMPAALRKDADAIDAVLSPLQQAKFRILELDVERHLREVREHVREQRRGGAPGRGGDGPIP